MISALLIAVSISLSSPSDYKLTPFPYDASYLRGEVAGPNAEMSVPRLEEFAFLSEAFAERDMALGINLLGSFSNEYSYNNIHRCVSVSSWNVGQLYPLRERTPRSLSIEYCLEYAAIARERIGGVCVDNFSIDNGVYLTDSSYKIGNTNWWVGALGNKPYRKTGDDRYLEYRDIFSGIDKNKPLAYPFHYIKSLYHNLSVATCGLKLYNGSMSHSGGVTDVCQRGNTVSQFVRNYTNYTNVYQKYTYTYVDKHGETEEREAWCVQYPVPLPTQIYRYSTTNEHTLYFNQYQCSYVDDVYSSRKTASGWNIPTTYSNRKVGSIERSCNTDNHQSPLADATIMFYDDDLAKIQQGGAQLGIVEGWAVYLGKAEVYQDVTGTGTSEDGFKYLLSTNFVSICKLPDSQFIRTGDYKGVEFSCNIWSHGISQVWNTLNLNSYVGSPISAPPPADMSGVTTEEVISSSSSKIVTAQISPSKVYIIVKVKPTQFHARLLQ